MLNKNLEMLEKKNSILAELIKNNTEKNIEVLETKDGNYTAKLNGKLLHSMYKPFEEADKYISNYDIKNKDVVIILGFGFSYYVQSILKELREDTKIFIIEHNLEVLKKCFEKIELSDILSNDKVYIYHTSQTFEFNYDIEAAFKIGIVPEYEIINHKIEYFFYENDYIKFVEVFKNEISNILMNTSTIFEFSKMWHRNSYINMIHFSNSIGINKIKNNYKEVPAIIVSAGPSLDKNIKYLKWVKNKAIIIAVGTSLKKLLNENIIPDFIMALDGGEPNWEHFKNMDYSKIPLIYEPMVHPNILKYHKGKKLVFVSQNIVGSWGEHIFGEKGFLKMGGSVALSCYDFAVYIGANPIILMGQDLAYTGGRTHVSGSTYEKDIAKENKQDIHQLYLKDIYGDDILSDRKFFSFKMYFERFISGDKKRIPDLKVIDCTEGGAKIDFTEIMTFKDVYFKYIYDKNINIENDLKIYFENINKEENIKKLYEAKNEITKKLNIVKKEVNKGIKILKNAINKKDYTEMEELNNIDILLNENIEVSNLVRYISQHIISDVLKNIKKENDEEKVLNKNLKLYEGIKKGIEYNLKCIEDMVTITSIYTNHI